MAPVAPPWAAAIAVSTRTTRITLANVFSLDINTAPFGKTRLSHQVQVGFSSSRDIA
jgi:hypothetical protein